MKAKFQSQGDMVSYCLIFCFFIVSLTLCGVDFTQICILWRITRLFAFYDSGLFETL